MGFNMRQASANIPIVVGMTIIVGSFVMIDIVVVIISRSSSSSSSSTITIIITIITN